ncbi:MAG: hypothetical protein MZV70_48635 [Desulfobacterales bacterium]|nr:hypothetical protein [Desulfobacterales bacterium]
MSNRERIDDRYRRETPRRRPGHRGGQEAGADLCRLGKHFRIWGTGSASMPG